MKTLSFFLIFLLIGLFLNGLTQSCSIVNHTLGTGYTLDSITKIGGNLVLEPGRVGWMRFDIGTIPQGSFIQSVHLEYFIYWGTNPGYWVKSLSLNPISASSAELLAAIPAGIPYMDEYFPSCNSHWETHQLSQNAIDDVQNHLGGVINIGFDFTATGGNSNILISGVNSLNRPHLIVDYYPVLNGSLSGTLNMSTYYVTGPITVDAGQTLSIQPGTEFVFQGHYPFNVYGRIVATGTESDPILFTAEDTDTGWHSLRFFDTNNNGMDGSHLSWCVFEYGNGNYGPVVPGPADDGGAVYCEYSSNILFENCTFRNNKANFGGGLSIRFNSAPILRNCLITNNLANQNAGGIAVMHASPTLENCTITSNLPSGVRSEGNCNLTIDSCVLWDNVQELDVVDDAPTVQFCVIEGGWEGGTNSGGDPLFADPVNGDFSPTWTDWPNQNETKSSCIFNGNPALSPDTPYHCSGMIDFEHPDAVYGTWSPGPVYIDRQVHVPSDQTLIIQPGVEVLVSSGNCIDVYGNLQCAGTQQDTIRIASWDLNNRGRGIRIYDNDGRNSSHIAWTVFEDLEALGEDPWRNGAGLFCQNSPNVLLEHSIFRDCESGQGGAIFLVGSSIAMNRVLIHDCTSLYNGGAIYCNNSEPVINHCTAVNNVSQNGSGDFLFLYNGSHPVLTNSCSWNPQTNPDIYFNSTNASCSIELSYCDLPGGVIGVETSGNGTVTDGGGNFEQTPLLDSDYAAGWANAPWEDDTRSPLIDAGDPNAELDVDGTLTDIGAVGFVQIWRNSVPLDQSEKVTTRPTFRWTSHPQADGYYLSLGTDTPPSDVLLQYDLGCCTSWQMPSPLDYETGYYWSVEAYAADRVILSSPVLSFTTQSDIVDAGQMFQFQGDSQNYLEVPYSSGINPEHFTVSMWVRPMSVVNYQSMITSRETSGNTRTGYTLYLTPDGNWNFWMGSGGFWSIVDGGVAAIGTWTHLAGTYDGLDQTLYVNGVSVGLQTAPMIVNDQRPLRIGAGSTENPNPGNFFNGMIDDVRIWDHARTGEEIQEDMAYPLTGYEDGLVALWRFDDDDPAVAWNAIGINHAYLMNEPVRMDSDSPITGTLATPQNVLISIQNDVVELNWNPVPGAGYYKVYSSDGVGGDFVEDQTGAFEGTAWTAPAVTRRWYRASAVRD